MNPLSVLPAGTQKYVQAAYAFIGVVLGSIQVAVLTSPGGEPHWLVVALVVFAYLGGALGMQAAVTAHQVVRGEVVRSEDESINEPPVAPPPAH